jgi:hypothetical protein
VKNIGNIANSSNYLIWSNEGRTKYLLIGQNAECRDIAKWVAGGRMRRLTALVWNWNVPPKTLIKDSVSTGGGETCKRWG